MGWVCEREGGGGRERWREGKREGDVKWDWNEDVRKTYRDEESVPRKFLWGAGITWEWRRGESNAI